MFLKVKEDCVLSKDEWGHQSVQKWEDKKVVGEKTWYHLLLRGILVIKGCDTSTKFVLGCQVMSQTWCINTVYNSIDVPSQTRFTTQLIYY